MKKKIMNNFPLKMASVLIAILVWLVVVNIDDPIVVKRIENVVVRVQNGTYIEDMRKTYRIDENKNLIDVIVRDKRSVVEKLTANDIHATADLTQIISFDTKPIMVPIRVTCDKVVEENITAKTQAIEIIIEELKTKEFIINPSVGESKPGKGFEIGTLTAIPEKVTISGPESTIEKISKVVAPVKVADKRSDFSEESTLVIIDQNQEAMNESQTQYLRYKDIGAKVSVNVKLWRVQNNIRIEAGYKQRPASGFRVSEITTTPSDIAIAGSDEALKKLAEGGNVIQIPQELIETEGKSADFEQKIDITEYLPDDTKLATDVSNNIIVKVTILPEGSKEYDLAMKDIRVDNKVTGYAVGFGSEKVVVRVKGITQELEKLQPENIKASVDLKNLGEGEHTVPVNITLPEGYELVEAVSVTLRLEKTIDS